MAKCLRPPPAFARDTCAISGVFLTAFVRLLDAGLNWCISDAQKAHYLADPESEMESLLRDASTRTMFLLQYLPTTAIALATATISRTAHTTGESSPGVLLVRFAYYDGLGRQVQVIDQVDDVDASSVDTALLGTGGSPTGRC